jgi:hypothetical protein
LHDELEALKCDVEGPVQDLKSALERDFNLSVKADADLVEAVVYLALTVVHTERHCAWVVKGQTTPYKRVRVRAEGKFTWFRLKALEVDESTSESNKPRLWRQHFY